MGYAFIIYLLVAVGIVTVFLKVICPLIEAVIFGHMYHFTTLCDMNWSKVKFTPRIVLWMILEPWHQACSRLFGINMYTDCVETTMWTYSPPFKLKRNKTNKRKVQL